MGMRLNDFEQCTPFEFSAIAKAWHDNEERHERGEWERSRMQCMCMLQPYSKKQLKPHDVMRFSWDGGDNKDEDLSRDEIMKRFEEAKERYKL
jgi:hypothetical protein